MRPMVGIWTPLAGLASVASVTWCGAPYDGARPTVATPAASLGACQCLTNDQYYLAPHSISHREHACQVGRAHICTGYVESEECINP